MNLKLHFIKMTFISYEIVVFNFGIIRVIFIQPKTTE